MKKKIIAVLLAVVIFAICIIPLSAFAETVIVMLSKTSSSKIQYSSSTVGVAKTANYDCSNSILSTGYACARVQYAPAGGAFRNTSNPVLVVSPGDDATSSYTLLTVPSAYWRVAIWASGYVDSGNASVKI